MVQLVQLMFPLIGQYEVRHVERLTINQKVVGSSQFYLLENSFFE